LGPNASTPEDLFDNSNGDEEHEVEVVHCAKKKHKNCKGPFTIVIEVNEEKNSFM
jgi:hypothetical protein